MAYSNNAQFRRIRERFKEIQANYNRLMDMVDFEEPVLGLGDMIVLEKVQADSRHLECGINNLIQEIDATLRAVKLVNKRNDYEEILEILNEYNNEILILKAEAEQLLT